MIFNLLLIFIQCFSPLLNERAGGEGDMFYIIFYSLLFPLSSMRGQGERVICFT